MNEREALAEVLRAHVSEVVTSRLHGRVIRDAFCACGWELPWDLAEREEALTDHRAEVLAALMAKARSDALAPVLAFADQWHHPDHGGSCWGCAIMRAAASSHPTGNQP